MRSYYIQIAERHYPGFDEVSPLSGHFPTRAAALENALDVCRAEKMEFFRLTHHDPSEPGIISGLDGIHTGAIITTKNGLDEWWYAVKIIEVKFGF